jgi:hypothetical protein
MINSGKLRGVKAGQGGSKQKSECFSGCQSCNIRFIELMADTAEKHHVTRALHYLMVALVVVPLVYILSSGPAIILVVKAPKLRDPVRAVYWPMLWLHDHTSLKTTMDPYLAFWEKTARRF